MGAWERRETIGVGSERLLPRAYLSSFSRIASRFTLRLVSRARLSAYSIAPRRGCLRHATHVTGAAVTEGCSLLRARDYAHDAIAIHANFLPALYLVNTAPRL